MYVCVRVKDFDGMMYKIRKQVTIFVGFRTLEMVPNIAVLLAFLVHLNIRLMCTFVISAKK